MMWLGIVLHVSLNHMVGESPAPWRDPQTTWVADILIALIHAFRMPVFFILGGFFVAMLLAQRGWRGMLLHRLRRLGLPFAIFWPIVFPLMGVLVTIFVHQMVRGTLGFDLRLVPKPPHGPLLNTMHLWFLYMLMWFCIFTACGAWLARYIPARWISASSRLLYRLATAWWGVLLLAIPLAFVGAGYRAGLVTASGSFVPHFSEWVQNIVFFVVGLALYYRRDEMLDLFCKWCWFYAAAGLLCFIAWLTLYEVNQAAPGRIAQPQFLMAWVYGCTSWLWSFALMGGFARYLPRQSARLQYLADSSYWAYLVHMLGTIGFGALLVNLPLAALVKMGLNMGLTTLFCLISYQIFVRDRWIGRLLNGAKLVRKDDCSASATTVK